MLVGKRELHFKTKCVLHRHRSFLMVPLKQSYVAMLVFLFCNASINEIIYIKGFISGEQKHFSNKQQHEVE